MIAYRDAVFESPYFWFDSTADENHFRARSTENQAHQNAMRVEVGRIAHPDSCPQKWSPTKYAMTAMMRIARSTRWVLEIRGRIAK
jgi:hypothetical protein